MAQSDRGRRSAIDRRTTRHADYLHSQRWGQRVEEVIGWIKMIGGSKLRYLGRARNQLWFDLTDAYNRTRLAQLMLPPPRQTPPRRQPAPLGHPPTHQPAQPSHSAEPGQLSIAMLTKSHP